MSGATRFKIKIVSIIDSRKGFVTLLIYHITCLSTLKFSPIIHWNASKWNFPHHLTCSSFAAHDFFSLLHALTTPIIDIKSHIFKSLTKKGTFSHRITTTLNRNKTWCPYVTRHISPLKLLDPTYALPNNTRQTPSASERSKKEIKPKRCTHSAKTERKRGKDKKKSHNLIIF